MTDFWNQIKKCVKIYSLPQIKAVKARSEGSKHCALIFLYDVRLIFPFGGSWICIIQFWDEPSLKGREQHVSGDIVCRERDRKKWAKGGPVDLLSRDSDFLPNVRHVHIFTHRRWAVACVHSSPRVQLVSADHTVTGWKCSYPRCHLDQNLIQVWLVDISCGQLDWTSRQDWRFDSVMKSSTVETVFLFCFVFSGWTEYTERISQHCSSNLTAIVVVETFCKVIKWLLIFRLNVLKMQPFSIP